MGLGSSLLHLSVMIWLRLNKTLRVIMIRSSFKRCRFPSLSCSCLTIYRAIWLIRLWLSQIRRRSLLDLIDWVVLLLPIILCGEMRSLRPLMVMKCLIVRVLSCCWFWTVLANEILGHSNMTTVYDHIKHWVRSVLCGVILVMGVLKILLLLHLLLLLKLLLEHLLLLVLAQSIELVVLHSLLLLNRHCLLFIRIGKEIILFHIRLIDLRCRGPIE